MLRIPECSNDSSSQEVPVKGLMGLQCSSGDAGDGSFLLKDFLAVVTPCILLLATLAPGSVASGQLFIKDFGDNKEEEDGCLLPG